MSQELDDYFEIIIDSAHDHRNAYVFQVNPLGTQRDALITEEQRTQNSLEMGIPDGTGYGLLKHGSLRVVGLSQWVSLSRHSILCNLVT